MLLLSSIGGLYEPLFMLLLSFICGGLYELP